MHVGIVHKGHVTMQRGASPHPLLPPLCNVDWFNDPGDFIHKGNGSSYVVKDWHISDLFPGHWHVFQQLQHCMGHVLEGTVNQVKNGLPQ